MNATIRNWAFQTLGLIVGLIPAIFLVFAFPAGLICYAIISIGFVYPRSRAFAYGAVCSLLTLPGLALGAFVIL